MPLSSLTKTEQEVVRRVLNGAFRHFDFDFHTRLGLSEQELKKLLARWPDIDDTDDDSPACLAINNTLNDLLNGLGISDKAAIELTGVDRAGVQRVYKKWSAARGWSSTGAR